MCGGNDFQSEVYWVLTLRKASDHRCRKCLRLLDTDVASVHTDLPGHHAYSTGEWVLSPEKTPEYIKTASGKQKNSKLYHSVKKPFRVAAKALCAWCRAAHSLRMVASSFFWTQKCLSEILGIRKCENATVVR